MANTRYPGITDSVRCPVQVNDGTTCRAYSPRGGSAGRDDVASWSMRQKLLEAARRAAWLLPAESRDQFMQLFTPENLAMTAGFFMVAVGVQFVPIAGEIVDLCVMGVTAVYLGSAVLQFGRDMASFATTAAGADTSAELDRAAASLAHGVALVGVNTAVAMILHKGAKIAGRENFKSQGIRTTGALTYTEAAHGLWPELPPEHAANFTSVDPVWLKPGTPLYRVFGEFGEKAKLDGNYWSTEKPPNTELEWRNGQAVWKDWNTGKQFTEMRVGPKGLKIWEGIVAPQSRSRLSGVDTQHLPGGGRQVYFPVGQFGIAEPGPNPAPWHSH